MGIKRNVAPRIGFVLYPISNLYANGDFLPAHSLRIAFNTRAMSSFIIHSSFNTLPTKVVDAVGARLAPAEGGNTEFCDARAAYVFWDPICAGAPNATARKRGRRRGSMGSSLMNVTDGAPATPCRRAPSGGAHGTQVGGKSPYLGSHVTHLVDWPREESSRFTATFNAHVARPEFRYVQRVARW